MKEVERRMEKMGEDGLRLGLNRGLSHFCDCAVRPGRAYDCLCTRTKRPLSPLDTGFALLTVAIV